MYAQTYINILSHLHARTQRQLISEHAEKEQAKKDVKKRREQDINVRKALLILIHKIWL